MLEGNSTVRDSQAGRPQEPLRERVLSKQPRLTGSVCTVCGAYTFPSQSACSHCGCREVRKVSLSRKGRLETFTIIRHARPGYRGPVPYAIGAVSLPEGVRLRAVLHGCQPEELLTGIEVELHPIKPGADCLGNDVMAQARRPV